MTTMGNTTAQEAVAMLCTAVNRGGRQADVADALGGEHGYLVNQLVHAFALGVVRKCRFALRSDENEPVTSCGSVMGLLASGPNPTKDSKEWYEGRTARDDHPYHDGELTCNAVRGALVTLLGREATTAWHSAQCWVWK